LETCGGYEYGQPRTLFFPRNKPMRKKMNVHVFFGKQKKKKKSNLVVFCFPKKGGEDIQSSQVSIPQSNSP